MKLLFNIGAAALAIGLSAAPAMAQSSATASASGTTTIIQPLTVSNTAGLAFGAVVRPAEDSSTITIANSADSASATGDAVLLGTTSRAKFSIAGEGGQAVSVTVPSSFNMTRSGGTETLAVTLSGDLGSSATLSGSAGSAGAATLNVGGAFTVADDTVTGSYAGSFDVTVAYQ